MNPSPSRQSSLSAALKAMQSVVSLNNEGEIIDNLLDSSDEIIYIIYTKSPQNNFISSKWHHFFGFNPSIQKDLFSEMMKCMLGGSAKEYKRVHDQLKPGKEITIQYNIINKLTKEKFCLSERIRKEINLSTNEIIYCGKISNVTNELSFVEYQQKTSAEKEKLELLSNHSPDIVFLTDAKGVIEYVSPSVENILGYSSNEMLHKSLQKFIAKNCQKLLFSFSWLQNGKEKNSQYEYNMIHKNGELLHVESAITKINSSKGILDKILMHNRVVRVADNATNRIVMSEHNLRSSLDEMQLAVLKVDNAENIIWANKVFSSMTGYSNKELLGKNANKLLLFSEIEAKKMNHIIKDRKMNMSSFYEIKLKNKNGQLIDVIVNGSPLKDEKGKVIGSIGLHWDITQTKRLDRLIEEQRNAMQNEMMLSTLAAEEKEKELLGHELRDGVGQMLTYLGLHLQKVSTLEKVDADVHRDMQQRITETINEVRTMSQKLAPLGLAELGLKDSIIELINQLIISNETKFLLDCKESDLKDIFPHAQRFLYSIIKELLKNAIAQKNPTAIKLAFHKSAKYFIMNYSDNGIVLDQKRIDNGNDLTQIINKVILYEGNIKVNSITKEGSSLTIEFPLKTVFKI